MRRITAGSALAVLLSSAVVTAAAASAHPTYKCAGHRATVVGTMKTDYLNGTPGNDVIVARGGNDVIHAGGGNDIICGGYGHDNIWGGRGKDAIYGGKDGLVSIPDEEETDLLGDQLDGGPGNDRLVGGQDTRQADQHFRDIYTYEDAPRPVAVDLRTGQVTGGAGNDQVDPDNIVVVGSRYNDVMRGGPGDDWFSSSGGSDVLRGRGGDDILVADVGPNGKTNDDRLYGGAGDDQLDADLGEDLLHGGAGDDSLDDVASSADRMYGDSGDDVVIAELWNNGKSQVLDGGSGHDHLSVLTTDLGLTNNPGVGTWDMVSGAMTFEQTNTFDVTAPNFEDADFGAWGSSWTVEGTDAANTISAGTWGINFSGKGGDDTLTGSTYPDRYDGGPGNDTAVSMGVGPGDQCISVENFTTDDCDSIS